MANGSRGLSVSARPNETNEQLVKRFVRKWRESGLKEELRDRSFYAKTSAARREKHKKALSNSKRLERKDAGRQ